MRFFERATAWVLLYKIQYISENKVYLSTLNSFNDPFEGKFLIFNQDKLAQEGWDIDLIYDYYDNLRNFWHATCLSDTNEQNMPHVGILR